ncbi:uncharacterized protein MELLADRAFT_66105 [Melampsora larici-populina 98AG31]|uniref:Uncharacterized protein n=1 Tax=Melampsora larici-populina (strain 98AG31 / pathotype 3-4-7) TaxID=747676 RepID=F4RXW8_MELLP|nr:uncharacterized protein MELLADRAFT_66105 [Melampsora larici-populina 98AG31]EGG02803.1 hypothetical protein MELLADRAFT_66105 [Melampsora larici-populina 98AG31]
MPPQSRQNQANPSFSPPVRPPSDILLRQIMRYRRPDFVLSPRPLQCIPTPVHRSASPKKSVKPLIPESTPVKARSKKTIPLILKDAKHNPSITSSRKHTYRPSIKGPIILVTDHSKIPKPIPLASQVLGMELTNIDEVDSITFSLVFDTSY